MQIILINKNSIDFNLKLTRFNNVIIKVEGDTLVFDGSSLCFGSLYLDYFHTNHFVSTPGPLVLDLIKRHHSITLYGYFYQSQARLQACIVYLNACILS